MIQLLHDYYHVPENSLGRVVEPELWTGVGYFQFGSNLACYGQSRTGIAADIKTASSYNAAAKVEFDGDEVRLPFSPTSVVDNLRHERYLDKLVPGRERVITQPWMLEIYYAFRALLPASIRRRLQRAYFSDWRNRPFPAWPVDCTVDVLHEEILKLSMKAAGIRKIPFVWFWPDGAPSCLIMTHDVETSVGRDFSSQLMDLDNSYGIPASFQVIPEQRYKITAEYVAEIKERGFEFNIHDLNHDGNLYRDHREFLRRAATINEYAKKYGALGFRSGAMYRNLDWYDAFKFSYDMSVPNVAHLEPKRGGCCTVMPFYVGDIIELPLTATQDYSLFHILGDYSIELWKKQLEMIRQRNGLMSFIAHPDYLTDRSTRGVYELLLRHLRQMVDRDRIWAALPREVDQWWRARSEMRVVKRGCEWEIEGPESERACLAFAVLDGDRLSYEIAESPAATAIRS